MEWFDTQIQRLKDAWNAVAAHVEPEEVPQVVSDINDGRY